MARQCPGCGGLMEIVAADDKYSKFWCKHDGGFMTVANNGAGGRAKYSEPAMARAYSEFSGYLSKDSANRPVWRTLFFKLNDPSKLGVMLGCIMGVHQVREKPSGAWSFNLTTTSCTKIAFDYNSRDVAVGDRNRLIVSLERYHELCQPGGVVDVG